MREEKNVFSYPEIVYVRRVVVGNSRPDKWLSEAEIAKQQEEVNRLLNEFPRGRIIGLEKNVYLLNWGEHQAIVQYLVYHIGFTKRIGKE